MRIFIAGATGVIGIRLVPLLIADRHQVVGMTRSRAKAEQLLALGAEPAVCDVFDADALRDAVTASAPELVMDQLTDLPDDVTELRQFAARNDRMRTEGTRNLLTAAKAANTPRFLAQSIAWRPPGRGEVVEQHERMVLEAGGVVVRYGQLYGPDTFYQDGLPSHPRIHVDEAARATVPLLEAASGVIVVADDEHGS